MAQVAQTAQNQPKAMIKYTATNDAMAPAYPRGSIVIAREYDPTRFIEWGEAYLLDTIDGPILTRLVPGKDDDHYLARREDPERYPDIDIPKWAVNAVYRVVGAVCFK